MKRLVLFSVVNNLKWIILRLIIARAWLFLTIYQKKDYVHDMITNTNKVIRQIVTT